MSEDEIDYDSPTPPYRQIAAVIIDEIKRGELRPDRPIPSEATMIQRWGVARDTARRAVRYLREEGYVYTVPQRGTFVSPPSADSE
ncbi:DNA-binding GntR family transcriptional regulator [Nocardiopsis mwathae]|uniref:DNA-binding GntR family transcriptional regulator n=1 Tax=Nocardiopsis mwathae TaxID=1472723 RepID=A0A7W9YEB1_9ACTN|nr:winged helix-turn-helix domain-containing protein [Nocardiopsis mwathae]MBB6170605.1 DNA-binding GntR family transcriptional regulator [Nocardiopsis mwathae]